MALSDTQETSSPGEGRLGFTFRLTGGAGRLTLSDRTFFGWLTVERLELEVPDLPLPIDLSAGPETFQRRRTCVRHASLRMNQGALDRLIADRRAELEELGVDQLELKASEGYVGLHGRVRESGQVVELTARIYLTGSGHKLRLLIHRAQVYGYLPTPAPLWAHRVVLALLGGESGEGAARAVVRGLCDLELEPLRALLWNTLPSAGWRLPESRELELLAARLTRGAIVVKYGAAGERDTVGEQPPVVSERDAADLRAALDRFFAADDRLRLGDLEGAMRAYRSSLAARGPEDLFLVERILSLAAARREFFIEATELARQALSRWPELLSARAALASVAVAQGDADSAAAHYRAIAEGGAEAKADVEEVARAALAGARLLRPIDPRASTALFERVLEHRPKHPEASEALADRYAEEARWQDLVGLIRAQLAGTEDERRLAREHTRLAEIFAGELGDPEGARAELERACELDPECAWAHEVRADVEVALGDETAGVRALDTAAGIYARTGDARGEFRVHTRAAALFEERADDEAAEDRYRRALELLPDDPGATSGAARAASRLGRHAEAADLWRRLDRASADSPRRQARYACELGRTLVAAGDVAEARPALERAARTGEGAVSAEAHALLAQIFQQAGELAASAVELAAAAEAMVNAAQRAGRGEEILIPGAASASPAPAEELSSRAAELLVARAEVLERLGQTQAALENFSRAFEIAPGRAPAMRAARALRAAAAERNDHDEERRWIDALIDGELDDEERYELLLARVRVALASGDAGRDDQLVLADVNAALETAPPGASRTEALVLKSEILIGSGDTLGRARALAERAELAEGGSDKIDAVLDAAEAWLTADDPKAALAAARHAVELLDELAEDPAPGDGEAGERRRRALSAHGEAAWRCRDWEEVCRVVPVLADGADPGTAGALLRHRLGVALEKRGELEEAARVLESVVEDEEASGEIRAGTWRLLADVYERLGDTARAAWAHESFASDARAEAAEAARADAWYRAGELYRKHEGQRADAERCLEEALRVVGDHMPALDALERLKREDEDDERVAVILGRKVAATARHPARQKSLLVRLARMQAEVLGRPDVARETFGRALEIDPDYRPALRYWAEDARGRGEVQRAAEAYGRLARDLLSDIDLADDVVTIAEEQVQASLSLAELYAAAPEAGIDVLAVVSGLEECLAREPSETRLLEALERVHREHLDWEQLADVLGRKAAAAQAGDALSCDLERIEILWRTLDDPGAAMAAARAALARNPEDPALNHHVEALDALLGGEETGESRDPDPAAPPPAKDAGAAAEPTPEDPEGARALRARADRAASRGDYEESARALEALAERGGARSARGELFLELADLYYDHLGDPVRARSAMAQAAGALGPGARRDATLRLLANEAIAAGALEEAAEAYEAIGLGRLTPADRLALAKSHQRLGRDARALEVLEHARETGALSEEGAMLVLALRRSQKRKLDLAASLEKGAEGIEGPIAATRLREALALYDGAVADRAAADRVRARLAELGVPGGTEADPGQTAPDPAELEQAAAAAVGERDSTVAADLLERAVSERVRRHVSRGEALDDDTLRALEELRAIARRDHLYEPLARALFAASAALGDAEASTRLLREAAAVQRTHLHDVRGAADALTRALALAPGDASLIDQLDATLREAGDYSQLFSVYELHLATRSGEGRVPALIELARLSSEVFHEPARARAYAEEALELDPEAAREVRRELAELFESSAGGDAAASDAEGGEAEGGKKDPPEPDRPRALEEELRIAAELEAQGRVDAAIARYETASVEFPGDRRPLFALERLYEANGDHDALTEVLGRLIVATESPGARAQLWYRRSKLYRDVLRREPETYRCLKEAFANDPDRADIAHALRALAMARREWALAAELLYREIAGVPEGKDADRERAALYHELALIYDEKLLEADEAVRNYEQALELDPDIPAAPRPLGRLYELSGRHRDAARMHELAAAHAPDVALEATLLRRAAANAERAGEEDQARRLYGRAAELSGDLEGLEAEAAAVRLSVGKGDAGAQRQSLEARLERTEDPDEKADIRRRLLELAASSGDGEALERHARALLDANSAELSAYLALKSRATAEGNWEALSALLESRAELEEDPSERAAIYFELGRTHQDELGNLDEAVRAYEQALELESEHPGALESLAGIAYVQSDWLRARELYGRLSAEKCSLPADAIAYRRGEIAEVLGRGEEAVEAFAEAVTRFPANRESLAALARTAQRIGDLDRAIDASSGLLELLPADDIQALAAARLQLAELCHQAGRRSEAIACYERVLAEEPKSLPALTRLIELYRQEHDAASAARALRSLIALTAAPTRRAELLFELGELYRGELGDIEVAFDAYLKAIDLDPDHVPTLRRLLDYYWRIDDPVGHLEAAQELERHGALLDQDTGEEVLARTMVAAGLAGDPDTARQIGAFLGDDVLGGLARALLLAAERGGDHGPEELARVAIDLAARIELPRQELARACKEQGNDGDAARALLAALEPAPATS